MAPIVRLVREQRPDVALVDYRLPGGDGIATAARLQGAAPGLRVIILTGMATAGLVTQALAAGCSGFVTKDRSADEIVTAIQQA
ncbi:MAG: response regulator transcription factor [Candidatus Dormiibacterota bacterium]